MESIRERIEALSEPDFRRFASGLLPGVSNIAGVRLPKLRGLAKELAKGDWRAYLKSASDGSFEEVMLQGMVIGEVRVTLEELLSLTAGFVPKITNWSVCDSFCAGLKRVREDPERVWEFLTPYLFDSREFCVRFGVVMLLFYYIDEAHLDRVLGALDEVGHGGYYAKTAVSWALSICFIKFPKRVMPFLEQNRLDDFTYHKTLSKITESLCVDQETKRQIRAMRRK